MPNNYSIKVETFEGRRSTGWSITPAEDIEKAKELFEEKIRYWQGEKKGDVLAVKITLQCNDPVHIVEEKTVRG